MATETNALTLTPALRKTLEEMAKVAGMSVQRYAAQALEGVVAEFRSLRVRPSRLAPMATNDDLDDDELERPNRRQLGKKEVDRLIAQHLKGASVTQLSKNFNCSEPTIYRVITRAGLTSHRPLKKRKAELCEKEF